MVLWNFLFKILKGYGAGFNLLIVQDDVMNDENKCPGTPVFPDPDSFLKLARAKMPFGRYAGCLLVDLPEPYVVWFAQKGFPEGELGEMLRAVYEIKVNGLEYLFKPFKNV